MALASDTQPIFKVKQILNIYTRYMCILCIIHRATYQIKNVVVVAFINCIIKSREMKNLRKKYDYMNLFKQYVGFF